MPNTCGATITKPASSWSRNFDNVVMTRTFSKIYGLAGLRVGWALLPGGGRRRAQPRARAVQRLGAGAARGGRRR